MDTNFDRVCARLDGIAHDLDTSRAILRECRSKMERIGDTGLRVSVLSSASAVVVIAVLLFTLTACTQREIVPFNVKAAHPERFICEGLADRPAIPPEHVIDWSQVQTVEQAHSEHLAYVRSIRTREGKVAGYLVEIEGRHFQCASNMEWQRDYYDGLGD